MSSQLDQRAWLTGEQLTLSTEIEDGEVFYVQFRIRNTGTTPALNYVSQTRMDLRPDEPTSGITEVPEPRRNVVPPGTTTLLSRSPDWVPSTAAITLYRAGQFFLFIQIRISYDDIFGDSHWTTMCMRHAFGTPLNQSEYCSTGNDVDH